MPWDEVLHDVLHDVLRSDCVWTACGLRADCVRCMQARCAHRMRCAIYGRYGLLLRRRRTGPFTFLADSVVANRVAWLSRTG